LKKVNELLTQAIMLHFLILEFVIMLTELQKVLSQELKCVFVCVVSQTTTVLPE